MYKKRLKKWNIRKRTYRKTPITSTASVTSASAQGADTPSSGSQSTHGDEVEEVEADTVMTEKEQLYYMPPHDTTTMALVRPSNVGPYAGLEHVLGSVFSWSQCKLDSANVTLDPMSRYLANPNHPPIQDSRTMYRTFELVFDLWQRGKGSLAGMAARKGFFVLEYVLTEDHPDLIWHFLDTIYDMVDRGHLQLLGMFLAHANALAERQLPAQHPLLRILQQLLSCDYQTDDGRRYVCHLLRQAWLRNVDLLAEHIGSLTPEHLWLYEQLIWDGRTRLRKNSDLGRKEDMGKALSALATKHQQGASSDGESDRLRIEALMLEFTQMDLRDKVKAEQLALNLLRHTEGAEAPRASARFQAYARKMLARVQEDKQDWGTAEENLLQAIRKREEAHGTNNNLRVIRDMWVLAAHYRKAGQPEEAQNITDDAISRAHIYLNDIPG